MYCDFEEVELPKGSISQLPRRGTVLITVCYPVHKLCFIYSHGEHSEGRPELLAVDVPNQKKQAVQKILMFLLGSSKAGKVSHCYKAEICGYGLTTLEVIHEYQRRALITCMDKASQSAKVVLVKPVFDKWEPSLPIPGDKIDRQLAIFEKWHTWRNVHGDEALERIFRSGSGWECNLTAKEVKFVRNNWEYMVREAVAELLGFPLDEADDYIETVATSLRLAPQRYNQGIKVAGGSYTWDFLANSA
jgi:hypothetical protein